MITISILNNPGRLKRCTGLSKEQFHLLTTRLTPLWEEAERRRRDRSDRKRSLGAGHPYGLKTVEEKLFAYLLWLRVYPAYWFLGMSVGLHASNVCRLFVRLRPLLARSADPSLDHILKDLGKEQRRGGKPISSWRELKEKFPEVARILIDATEQPRQRPGKRSQRRYYSGKKKRHTVKTQLTVGSHGKVLTVSKPYPGSYHDFDVLQKEGTLNQLPAFAQAYLDRGYQGAAKIAPGTLAVNLPIKRSRWKRELTRSEKIRNTKQAKRRVLVEQVIAKLKKYQVLAQTLRHNLKNYSRDFRNVAALVNFRLETTPV